MITKKQLELGEALEFVKITALPPVHYPKKSKRIWVAAIIEVMKNNGSTSYAYAYNRYGSTPHYVKVWGDAAGIREILAIHPTYYLSKDFLPKFDNINDIRKLVCEKYDLPMEKVAALKPQQLSNLIYNSAIDAQIVFIKQEGEEKYKLKQNIENEQIFKEATGERN